MHVRSISLGGETSDGRSALTHYETRNSVHPRREHETSKLNSICFCLPVKHVPLGAPVIANWYGNAKMVLQLSVRDQALSRRAEPMMW